MHQALFVSEITFNIAQACAPGYKHASALNPNKPLLQYGTLYAVAQTCRALRIVYLPRIYEHIEVWINRGGYHGYKHLASRLKWFNRLLLPERDLANLVQ